MNIARHILIGCGLALLGATAHAETPVASMALKIAEQPMQDALNALAEQTGLHVIFPVPAVEGRTSPRIEGRYTPQAALDILLFGTSLFYEFVDARTIAIRSTAVTSAEASAEPLKLSQFDPSEVSVEDSRDAHESGGGLEEIVVTAQKRSELLQNVPISMSVLSGRDLDGFTGEGANDALAAVPGIKLTQLGNALGGGSQLGIRGVTASGPLFFESSPVAYYLDGVPFGLVKSAIVPDANVYDLERIEVLRGPQGTLYGASALNGVVRVLTHDADLEQFDLKTKASLSTTKEGSENYRGDLALNVPIVPGKLAARAVIGYSDLSGWIESLNESNTNDAELGNLRLKLNAQPTDALAIGLSAWLSRGDYGAPSFANDDNVFPGPLAQPLVADYDVFGFKLGYQFASVALSSTTSYIDYTNETTVDITPIGAFGVDNYFTGFYADVLSQEIVLNSTAEELWRWSLGGFYRDAEDRRIQKGKILRATVDFGDLSESFAVFGQLTRLFLDGKFELTGGLRYFRDDVVQLEHSRHTGVITEPLYSASDTFDAVSPRVVLTWHPSQKATLYGSYSEGFRSGFNQNAEIATFASNFQPVKEDTLRNYELGAKGSLADGRVTYDAALYYIDWQDVQQTLSVEIGTGLFFPAGLNGESASGIGVDLATQFRLTERLELAASVSWNDLSLDGEVSSGGLLLHEKGDRLNFSAATTAGVSFGYSFPVGQRLEGRFSAVTNYSSTQTNRLSLGTTVFPAKGDDIVSTRASASIGFPDHWTASLFADNVVNERGVPAKGTYDFWDARIRPLTLGVQFEYFFRR